MEALSKLGIDAWSILFYIINFGIIVFLLHRYLYKPLLDMVEDRRKTVRKNLTEAERLIEEMAKQRKETDEESKEIRKDMKDEIDKLKTELAAERKKVIQEATEEKTRIIEEATKRMEEREKKLVGEVEGKLLKTVQAVVKFVVSNKLPEEAIKSSVKDAWEKIK